MTVNCCGYFIYSLFLVNINPPGFSKRFAIEADDELDIIGPPVGLIYNSSR